MDALCGLAVSLMELGSLEEAQQAADAAASSDPEAERVQRVRSTILLRRGRGRAALEAALAAVRLYPSGYSAHLVLFNAQLATGRRHEAEATANRLRLLGPNRADTHCALGELRLLQARYREAEALFRSALRIDPADASAITLLGTALERRLKFREALEQYELAARSDPGNEFARRTLFDAAKRRLRLVGGIVGLAGVLLLVPTGALMSVPPFSRSDLGAWTFTVALILPFAGAFLARRLQLLRLGPAVRHLYAVETRAFRRQRLIRLGYGAAVEAVILVAALNLNVALEVRHAGIWTLLAPLLVLSLGSLVVLPLLYRRFVNPPWDRDWLASPTSEAVP